MKAIVYSTYGAPEVLRYEEIAQPVPGDDEVLVRVRAAAVNPLDWYSMRGRPYVFRLATGLRRPKDTRLGADVAGRVEAVGKNVTQIEPGDEVFGACRGALAEYVCAAESALVLKPPGVSFEQAAAVPVAALTALQALRDRGQVQAEQTVLINGAAGGVGTFAVQIAKALGAEVTGVCSTRNVDLVRSIGADRVVDYTRQDFTRAGARYDVILDCIGNHPLSACRRALKPKGVYVVIGGKGGPWIGPLFRMLRVLVLSPLVSQKLVIAMARRNKDDLIFVRDLIAAGKVTPVVDRRYELSEAPEAIRYLEAGHARGKVVVTV